ncbi:hypothetical protein DV738_g3654, partial [Chaetothyriales sp. CBS 135597]
MPLSRQANSPLFAIPAETRQAIYSALIPKGILDIQLCTRFSQSVENTITSHTIRHKSPIAALRQQIDALNSIKQTNGIHLLLVCQWMRLEVLELLASVTVRFHCPECFYTFLPSAARGLGVGVEWMKSVEILLDLALRHNAPTYHDLPAISARDLGTGGWAKLKAQKTMQRCQREAWKWYGPLHLTEKEKWTCDPLKVVSREEERDDNEDASHTAPGPAPDLGAAVNGFLAQHPQLAMHTAVVVHSDTSNAGRGRLSSSLQWVITGKFNI